VGDITRIEQTFRRTAPGGVLAKLFGRAGEALYNIDQIEVSA
jgi:hypothetical protein